MATDPPLWFVTWSFLPVDDDPPLITRDSIQTSTQAPSATPFVFEDATAEPSRWFAWPSESDPDQHGEPTSTALLTTRPHIAEQFRPGLTFDRYHQPAEGPPTRHTAGTLVAPATDPEWLTQRLLLVRGLAPDPVVPEAFRPWETTVDRARVSHDGLNLRLYLTTDRGEVPAAVALRETSDRVEVLVRVGIDPERPPRPIRTSAVPGNDRLRSARRASVEVTRCVGVILTRPLADRPVYDIGTRDRAAWSAARLAWQSAH